MVFQAFPLLAYFAKYKKECQNSMLNSNVSYNLIWKRIKEYITASKYNKVLMLFKSHSKPEQLEPSSTAYKCLHRCKNPLIWSDWLVIDTWLMHDCHVIDPNAKQCLHRCIHWSANLVWLTVWLNLSLSNPPTMFT